MSFIKFVLLSSNDDIQDVMFFEVDTAMLAQLKQFIDTGVIGEDLLQIGYPVEIDVNKQDCLDGKDNRIRLCLEFLQKNRFDVLFDSVYYRNLF